MKILLILLGIFVGAPIALVLLLIIFGAMLPDSASIPANNPYLNLHAPANETDGAKVVRIANESYSTALDMENVARSCEETDNKKSIPCMVFKTAYVDNLYQREAIHIGSTNKAIGKELNRTGRTSRYERATSYLYQMKLRVQ